MRNFGDAQSAVQTALNSSNSAMEENARYMESIQAKANKLSSEFQKLVLGDGGLEHFAKLMLDVATATVQLVEALGGLKSILTVLISAGLIIAINNFEQLAKSSQKLIGTFADMGRYLKDTIDKWIEMQINEALYIETTDAAVISTNMLKLSLGTLVAILSVAVIAFNAYQQAQEKATKLARDTVSSALEESEALEQQLRNLKNENASRKDLIQAIQAVDSAYQDEGQTIDELNKKRQESIDKLKEESKQALENAKQSGFGQYKKDREALQSGYGKYSIKLGSTQTAAEQAIGVFRGNTSEEYLEWLKKYQAYLTDTSRADERLNKTINELETSIREAKNGIEEYDNVLLQLGQVYDVVTGKIRALLPSEIAQSEAIDESIEKIEKQTGILEELGTSWEKIQDILDDSGQEKLAELMGAQDIEGIVELLSQYGIELDNVTEGVEEQGNAWDEYLENIEGIQSAYETLTKAVDEYNQNGYISASTLKKLNKLEPEHLALLAQEGDKYENIKQGLTEYLDAEKADALMKVELARQIAIVEACQNRLADASGDAETEIGDVGDTTEKVTPKMAELARTTTQAAIGMMAVKNAGKFDEDFKSQLDDINSYFDGLKDSINSVNLGAADSSKKSAGATKDAWVEAFEEEQRQLKHALEMNEITEIEYYQRLKELNEKYFGEISGNHQKYIKEYQENEEEIYKGMKAIYDKVADYLREAIEQGYEDAINALKKEEKKVLAEIKAQIEALKDEKKKVLDDIQKQIDSLKKKKDKVQDYWNSQIDKIKESNNELQKQNELLEKQQALQRAKAQKVMVMKGGKFQLGENESAVAQAEQSLAQYQDQMSYEQQIAEMEKLRDKQVETIDERIEKLEEYKDYMEEYYDEQIDALEKYYDQVEKQYEEQIEALQEQLDAFKKHAEEQKKIEEARLAAQLLGIEKESDLFEISLANLEDYVAKYNALVESLEVPSVFGDGLNLPVGGSAPSGGGNGKGTTITKAASGASSIGSDEVVLVGESPNAELVVGSHLNRSMGGGTLMNLSKGSGVVNAESTATLAGLLNGVVTPTNVSNSRSTMQTFTFGNLTLPNVTDAESFVNTLSHKFNNYAIQYGNSRK